MLCSSKRSWATPVVLMLYDDNGADQWSVKFLNFDIDFQNAAFTNYSAMIWL